MRRSEIVRGFAAVGLLAVAACDAPAASVDVDAGATSSAAPSAPKVAGYYAGPADFSRSFVDVNPTFDVAYAESSPPLAIIASSSHEEEEDEEHEPIRNPRSFARPALFDPVVQSLHPLSTMPAAFRNFLGQGNTNSPATMSGTPPDTNGAVGPHHYVQVVNGGIAVWDKMGAVVKASVKIVDLFAGYTGTNAGNGCGTRNDGDPVVLYDQMADRWFVTQFSLPHENGGPNFQCVAVSKGADPAGAYWLYDFQYAAFNDYGKFGVWPDAYLATFNMYGGGNPQSDICAYDRASMLEGMPATQACFQQRGGVFGALPVSLDGPIRPPIGTPAFFAALSGGNTDGIDLFKMKIDWKTPANTALTGPVTLPVAPFNALCNAGNCVPQPSPGNKLASLSDRPMFRFTYRNFGTHESMLLNHSVEANGTGGIRWYEIRSPNATPTIYQQGTYAPNDGNWRWMGSIAQDQSEAMALGFSISSASRFPSMAWTGRLPTDAPGTMGQGETIVDDGAGVETGTFMNGQTAQRWGDYSAMTIDPTDDCTFWYTTELYKATGSTPRTWDTQIAAAKFPSCAQNDFGIAVAPAAQKIGLGKTATYTVTTSPIAGTAESIALAIQDLPSGVTAAFAPATVSAGATSTLMLTAAANAPLTTGTPPTFTVIGKATSAVHPAYATTEVVTCAPLVKCPAPNDCGSMSDGCGGMVTCGTCAAGATCNGNKCSGGTSDAGAHGDAGIGGGAQDGGDNGAPPPNGDQASGSDSGCGCRVGAPAAPKLPAIALAAIAIAIARRRRR